jgi:mannose-6-phosphate isomerase-like protein (cupin superfamily)
VFVTTMDGKPLPEVWVKASGPVDREAATDPSGTATFSNVSAGTYRLRLEHEKFITLEKEVTVAAGRQAKVTAALNAAPPPPPPPKAEPPPAPVQPTQPPPGSYQPGVVSIESWIEANFVGRNPSKRAQAGCSGSTSSTMVQTNEAVSEHTHADADEVVYIVAGEGMLRMGGREHPVAASTFATIPRGTPHAMTKRGSRPLMYVSTLSGPPCQSAQ